MSVGLKEIDSEMQLEDCSVSRRASSKDILKVPWMVSNLAGRKVQIEVALKVVCLVD